MEEKPPTDDTPEQWRSQKLPMMRGWGVVNNLYFYLPLKYGTYQKKKNAPESHASYL